MFHTIEGIRGNIYFIKGNVRFQITCDDKIYFYLVDKNTYMPTLENIMFNNLDCSQLMFGARVKFGLAFKTGECNLKLYSRKCFHNFKVQLDTNSYEDAVGCHINTIGCFAVAVGLDISIND